MAKQLFRVMWTGLVEIEADTHQEAIDLVRNNTGLFESSTRWGASDGLFSYSEPLTGPHGNVLTLDEILKESNQKHKKGKR